MAEFIIHQLLLSNSWFSLCSCMRACLFERCRLATHCYIPSCSHLWKAQCYVRSYSLKLLGTCRHQGARGFASPVSWYLQPLSLVCGLNVVVGFCKHGCHCSCPACCAALVACFFYTPIWLECNFQVHLHTYLHEQHFTASGSRCSLPAACCAYAT